MLSQRSVSLSESLSPIRTLLPCSPPPAALSLGRGVPPSGAHLRRVPYRVRGSAGRLRGCSSPLQLRLGSCAGRGGGSAESPRPPAGPRLPGAAGSALGAALGAATAAPQGLLLGRGCGRRRPGNAPASPAAAARAAAAGGSLRSAAVPWPRGSPRQPSCCGVCRSASDGAGSAAAPLGD